MIAGLMDNSKPLPAGWQQIEIRGGAHDGRCFNVRTDENRLTLSDGREQFTYYRSPNGRPVFVYSKLLGGGR